jgi:iron complex outermembrane recepter protein
MDQVFAGDVAGNRAVNRRPPHRRQRIEGRPNITTAIAGRAYTSAGGGITDELFTLRVVESRRSDRKQSHRERFVVFMPAMRGHPDGCRSPASSAPQGGLAADAPSQPALMEIIVTAQKREQNLQDVPISVMALSGAQLKDAGVTDIKTLQVLTPGLTTTSTTSENVTTVRIRGIGTVGDNPGLESSVGVVIDGVYRARDGVGFGDLGEIDRIEVLEGPQGELFGKNNDAGVVNIVTKRPSSTFGVTAEVSAGNFNDREISASVTGPLGDLSSARLFVGYQKRDGFLGVDTGAGPNSDTSTDNRNFYTLRGQYLLTPSDDVNFLVIADYTKRNESCCGAVQVADGPFYGLINALASVPQLGGQTGLTGIASPPLSPFDRIAYANQPIAQQIRDTGISGELNWNLGAAKFTSITAYRENTLIAGNDFDYTARRYRARPGDRGQRDRLQAIQRGTAPRRQDLDRSIGSSAHFSRTKSSRPTPPFMRATISICT